MGSRSSFCLLSLRPCRISYLLSPFRCLLWLCCEVLWLFFHHDFFSTIASSPNFLISMLPSLNHSLIDRALGHESSSSSNVDILALRQLMNIVVEKGRVDAAEYLSQRFPHLPNAEYHILLVLLSPFSSLSNSHLGALPSWRRCLATD